MRLQPSRSQSWNLTQWLVDGSEILAIQESQLLEQCRLIKEKELKNVVLVGVFSTLDTQGRHELKAREIMAQELGEDVNIVCSSEGASLS